MISLGYELYAANALNLAMSIKAYAPEVDITLIHDDCINGLNENEKSFFDLLIPVNPEDYLVDGKPQYQRLKLCVDKYTPYEKTLYIDVDSIMFPEKSVLSLFDALKERDFFIGYNGHFDPITRTRTNRNYTYWHDNPKVVCNYFGLKNKLPQTISGTFYFTKSEFCSKLFELARNVYDDANAPFIKWANGKPDEYCFNVALSKLNYTQQESHLLYFDKINGPMENQRIYSAFWGLAAGGNKLIPQITRLYNELVVLYSDYFGIEKHLHIDKKNVIPERV